MTSSSSADRPLSRGASPQSLAPTSALESVVASRTATAETMLRSSSRLAELAERIAKIIQDLKIDGAPFTTVTLDGVVDPEIPGWEELVFSVELEGDFAESQRWLRRMSERRVVLSQQLSETDRELLASRVGLEVWPAE